MSESPRCGTCRFWVHEDKNNQYSNVRMCDSPKILHGGGYKRNEDDTKSMTVVDDEHVLFDDEAAVADASSYYAKLFPAANFGCIHWTEKD